MVEEIERLISRGRSAGGTVTPASRGMPPSSGAARGRQMTPSSSAVSWKWARGLAAADLLDAAA